MKKFSFFSLFIIFLSSGIHPTASASIKNQVPKISRANRISNPVTIDGKLNENQWHEAEEATGFYQYEPHNDRPASQKTEVKVLYDNYAIYIGARLYDNSPEKILTQMGIRDADDRLNADQFWVDINPFNDGINGFRFKVSASGVQSDLNMSGSGGHGDLNWDAVWESAVNIDKQGWVVEMRIPYSALRFPKNEIHEWGINFWREVRRTRETSSWNFVDVHIGNPIASMGILSGIQDVTPPMRLSLYPYLSAYAQKDGLSSNMTNSINGGLDLKMGISQNFTLDMTLIPDFGQVESDAMVLNLSPFEVKYDEKRQFFTEGTELFSKADLFYSRRIGSRPAEYYKPVEELQENEVIVENPLETSMINASKFSGRTSSGLGIGIFNAMTSASRSVLLDSVSDTSREIVTQPFTNYNLIVLDQSLPNNSYVSLVNTNVAGSLKGYNANVTGTEFRILDASNMYRISGTAALSQQYYNEKDNIYGYKYHLSAGKYGGTWRYNYSRRSVSHTYDQNDMGYLSRNNLIEDEISFSHNILTPFWKLNQLVNSISVEYASLHEQKKFTDLEIEYDLNVLFYTRFHIGLNASFNPKGSRDYFEPRVAGRFYETDESGGFRLAYSSDYRKRIYFDGDFYYYKVNSVYGQEMIGFEFEPNFRASDRFNISYNFDYLQKNNDLGYVGHQTPDSVFFGKRFSPTIENSIGTSYVFSNDLSLTFKLRHYWSQVDYDGNYYLLMQNGKLQPLEQDLEINDINYNAFTIDMLLTWNFAPGSQLTAAWKNVIDSQGSFLSHNYFNNLEDVLNQPQINSFSVKLLYYLDYLMLKRLASR